MAATLDDRVELLERKVEHLADERVKPLEEQVPPLAAQVKRLDTWSGPGQNEMLADNLADLRKKFDNFGKVQARHTKTLKMLTGDVAGLKSDVAILKTDVAELKTDVAELKTDVAGLKTDMVEVKGTLGEILDRLPPRRGDGGQ
jgi:chromosome segregation ATPase